MKKITLLTFLLIATTLICTAQRRTSRKSKSSGDEQSIGVTLGGSYTFVKEDDRLSGVDYGTASGARGLVGISFRKQLNRTFFTNIDFLMELGEYKVQLTDEEEDISYTATYKNHILVPVLFGYEVPKSNIYAMAGPFASTHLSRTIDASGLWLEPQTERGFTLGLAAGVGYTLPLTTELKASAELRHNQGLVTFNEDPIKFKLSSTQLLLGIRYTIAD